MNFPICRAVGLALFGHGLARWPSGIRNSTLSFLLTIAAFSGSILLVLLGEPRHCRNRSIYYQVRSIC